MKFFTVLFLLFITPALAADVVGVGVGATEDEAKKEALADLSSIIKVQVYSKLEMRTNSKGETDSNKLTRLTTNLPLLNPTINYAKDGKSVKAFASLRNNEIYSETIQSLVDDINRLTDDVSYRKLQVAAKVYGEYEKYFLVARVVGFQNIETPKLSLSDINYKISEMQETPSSLEVAAEILTQEITEKDIYVAFPKPTGSDETTEFSRAFKNILSSTISSSGDKGKYNLDCRYTATNVMIVTCSLMSGAKVLYSSIVSIPLILLKSLEFTPTQDKASSIFKEQIATQGFKAELRLETDGNPLIIKGDEKATILVKLNKPAYIYIVGYFRGVGESYSYLQPIKLRKIADSSLNRWVSLGSFGINAKKGEYTLQLIALAEDETFKPELSNNIDFTAKKIFETLANIKGEKSTATVTFNKVGG